MTLQVTQAAITEILRLYQHHQGAVKVENRATAVIGEADSDAVPVQLDFVTGGCAEQRYQLNFNSASSMSQAMNFGAVALHISPDAWPYVQQLTLDYVEDLMGGSFRFDNPQLPETCNCGQSFRLRSPE